MKNKNSKKQTLKIKLIFRLKVKEKPCVKPAKHNISKETKLLQKVKERN